MNPVQIAWFDNNLIAILLAINPRGLKGVVVKSQFGPVRDTWLSFCSSALSPQSKILKAPANLSAEQLFGSLDIESSLLSGSLIMSKGILDRIAGQYLILPMAERMDVQVMALISQALDEKNTFTQSHESAHSYFGLIAFDESQGEEEGISLRLSDRLAFEIHLDRFAIGDTKECLAVLPEDIQAAKVLLPQVGCAQEFVEVLTKAGLSLGIDSMRANQFVLEAAKTLAALRGLNQVGQDEVIDAARLVYSHTNRVQSAPDEQQDSPSDNADEPDIPAEDQAQQPDESNDAESTESAESSDAQNEEPSLSEEDLQDMVVEAVQASLPPSFLLQLNQHVRSSKSSSGITGKSGAIEKNLLSGRPLGSRKGSPKNGGRLDILKSIRSAIPWQRLRAQSDASQGKTERINKIYFRSEDLHMKQYLKRRGTVTIFLVDASGSSATQRLSEAKGALEELLAQCYIRRDEVAMLSMRGAKVETVLPPTRSLVRAKRNLATLPGGGGTPLALGLRTANEMAISLQRKGLTPIIVILTDGKANVNLQGVGGRQGAHSDALMTAKELRLQQHRILFVDTSPQPESLAQQLASAMDAQYFPLPYVGSGKKISQSAIQLAKF